MQYKFEYEYLIVIEDQYKDRRKYHEINSLRPSDAI